MEPQTWVSAAAQLLTSGLTWGKIIDHLPPDQSNAYTADVVRINGCILLGVPRKVPVRSQQSTNCDALLWPMSSSY